MKIIIFKYLCIYIFILHFALSAIVPYDENKGEIEIGYVGVSERCFKEYNEIVKKKEIKLNGYKHFKIMMDLKEMFKKEIEDLYMQYRNKNEFKFVNIADKSMVRVDDFFLVSCIRESRYNCVFNRDAISIDYYVFNEIVNKVPGIFVLDKHNRYWYYVKKGDYKKINFKKIKKPLVEILLRPLNSCQYLNYGESLEKRGYKIKTYGDHREIIDQINYKFPEVEGYYYIEKDKFKRIETPKEFKWLKGKNLNKNEDFFFLIIEGEQFPLFIYNKNKINDEDFSIEDIVDEPGGYFVKDRFNRIWFYYEDKDKNPGNKDKPKK